MNSSQNIICLAKESRALDQKAQEYGISETVLMENAARSILEAAISEFPSLASGADNIIFLNGPGQNGGDGWALARHLNNLYNNVHCYCVADPKKLKGAALVNYQIYDKMKLPITIIRKASDLPDWGKAFLVVDALYGTGLSGPVDPITKMVLESANAYEHNSFFFNVLSIDLPSGICPDTGTPLGPALTANLTVALGSYKRGHFLKSGPLHCGKLVLGDIGLPAELYDQDNNLGQMITPLVANILLPERKINAHKGTYGHVLVAGGSPGKTGALCLSAQGALQAGTGLVTAAHPQSLWPILETKLTEAMTLGVPEVSPGIMGEQAGHFILEAMKDKEVLALGPGLGTHSETQKMVLFLAENLDKPLILDADALNLLAGHLEILKKAKGPRLLTPHPGEAGRLLGESAKDVEEDRFRAISRLTSTGATVLLKGHRSLIAQPHSEVFMINPSGNQILATGGTGDILTGLIAGLVAQGLETFKAAALGSYILGRAGDLAVAESGRVRGILAAQIATFIPGAFAEIDKQMMGPEEEA